MRTLTDPIPYHTLKITGIRDETPGVKTFFLQPEDGKQFSYKAGQFISFVFQDIHGEERRSYSIISAPGLHEPLAITIKRIRNGKYSRLFFDKLKEGDKLKAILPTGQFTLPENPDSYQQIFFLAAGIGITPILPLIKTVLHRHQSEVVLVYSSRNIDDTVFYKEILALHEQFPERFRSEFLFSFSKNLKLARLSKWLLPQLIDKFSKGERSNQLFYTCGPLDYMRMVLITLEELGYSKEQVRKEIFDTTGKAVKLESPDKDRHQVIIKTDKKRSFTVQYPQTILSAARQNKIALPYSCETGKCGSCAMQCIEGKVWMSYNEVLTEKDLREGKVLTCTGYPMGGDVVLVPL